jgi:hypothetical protein
MNRAPLGAQIIQVCRFLCALGRNASSSTVLAHVQAMNSESSINMCAIAKETDTPVFESWRHELAANIPQHISKQHLLESEQPAL